MRDDEKLRKLSCCLSRPCLYHWYVTFESWQDCYPICPFVWIFCVFAGCIVVFLGGIEQNKVNEVTAQQIAWLSNTTCSSRMSCGWSEPVIGSQWTRNDANRCFFFWRRKDMGNKETDIPLPMANKVDFV